MAAIPPFHLHYALQSPHDPLQVPQAYVDDPACAAIADGTRRIYCGLVRFSDECIERTHGALAEAGMLPRTVSIVMSDNGGDPSAGGFNLPFRGTKATLFEVSCCVVVVVVVAAAATLQVTAYRTPLMHWCSTLR
eukprot:COSAG01_NODE_3664_length_5814_cov_15.571829_4_plen_135_part_00